MKNIILYGALSFLFLLSCSPSYNLEYKEYEATRPEWLKKTLEEGYEAEDPIYSILVFTSGYERESVLVINHRDTIFQGALNSDKSVGLAKAIRVDNTKPIKIIFKDATIKLKKKDAKNHKFVYLRKEFSEKYDYNVTYSKTPRDFR